MLGRLTELFKIWGAADLPGKPKSMQALNKALQWVNENKKQKQLSTIGIGQGHRDCPQDKYAGSAKGWGCNRKTKSIFWCFRSSTTNSRIPLEECEAWGGLDVV